MKVLLGALVVLMTLGGIALAQTTIDSSVTGQKEISVPTTTVDLGPMAVGDNGPLTLNGVAVNTNEPFQLTAGTISGYKGSFWGGAAYDLQFAAKYKLTVANVPTKYDGVTATEINEHGVADTVIADGTGKGPIFGNLAVPINFNQHVDIADPAGAVRTIILFSV